MNSAGGMRVEMCAGCFGDGGDRDEDDRWCPCTCCGGRGEIILCLGLNGPNEDCGGSVMFAEVEAYGAFCRDCRKKLDHPMKGAA